MDGAVEIVESSRTDGFAFLVKVRSTGRWFRVAPMRDPRQPRFWCVMVYRCMPSGIGDPSELPWFGSRGMERAEIPAAMAAIRADVETWLSAEECRELRGWLLAPLSEAELVAPAGVVGRGKQAAVPRTDHPHHTGRSAPGLLAAQIPAEATEASGTTSPLSVQHAAGLSSSNPDA